MSTATEFECLFGMFQWKNLLNEGLQFAIVDDLSYVREAPAIGLDANHRRSHAAFPCEVLPRLLRQRHENPAFFKNNERSPVRISAQRGAVASLEDITAKGPLGRSSAGGSSSNTGRDCRGNCLFGNGSCQFHSRYQTRR